VTLHYEARGWTPDGVPTRAKLEELHLGDAADRLGLA
jgi:aldehyde:ferredoxin oxidoreductase